MVIGLKTTELSRKCPAHYLLYHPLKSKMLNCSGLRKKISTEVDVMYVQFKLDDYKTILTYSFSHTHAHLFIGTWPQNHRYGKTVDLWLCSMV